MTSKVMRVKNIMDDVPVAVNPSSSRFIDQLRLFMRARHMAWATEKTYVLWTRRYIRFHHKRHPAEMGAEEIENYLNYLAVEANVAPGTQAIALNALMFLYRQFLQKEVGNINYQPAKQKKRVPVVFSHDEAMKVIEGLKGSYWLERLRLAHDPGIARPQRYQYHRNLHACVE